MVFINLKSHACIPNVYLHLSGEAISELFLFLLHRVVVESVMAGQ